MKLFRGSSALAFRLGGTLRRAMGHPAVYPGKDLRPSYRRVITVKKDIQ